MSKYEVLRHSSVASFADQCADLLYSDQIDNNEIISATQLLESSHHATGSRNYLASIVKNDVICGLRGSTFS